MGSHFIDQGTDQLVNSLKDPCDLMEHSHYHGKSQFQTQSNLPFATRQSNHVQRQIQRQIGSRQRRYAVWLQIKYVHVHVATTDTFVLIAVETGGSIMLYVLRRRREGTGNVRWMSHVPRDLLCYHCAVASISVSDSAQAASQSTAAWTGVMGSILTVKFAKTGLRLVLWPY